MELRRLLICTAFFVVAVLSSCSEGRHPAERAADDYDMFADANAGDDDTQNDADGDTEDDKEIPVNISTLPMTYTVNVTQNVRLECKTNPEGEGVVSWLKDGTRLFTGTVKAAAPDRYEIVNKSRDLVIFDVRGDDAGQFECRLEQYSGPKSIYHKLVVQESPSIIRFTATDAGRVLEDEDLLLTCEVAGMPPPAVTWSRMALGDNYTQTLREGDGEFSANRVLIRHIQAHHAGTYYCYVFNNLGHSEAALNVNVLTKPRVHVTRKIVNSALNVTAILDCTVHDDKPVTIRWYKDGVSATMSPSVSISTEGATSNLTVTPASSEDFGDYTCEAENKHGKHNQSITLVQKPIVEEVRVYGPKLAWTVHSHQPLQQIEIQLLNDKGDMRKVDVKLPQESSKKYEITYDLDQNQLEPGTYKAFVKVKNTNDWSTSDEEVPVQIADRPSAVVQSASMFGGAAHSIRPAAALLSTASMYLLVRML